MNPKLFLKKIPFLYTPIRIGVDWARFVRWRLKGRPGKPPTAYKRSVLRNYGKRYGLPVFIETGTYKGDTVAKLRNAFERIVSVELDERLFQEAYNRFQKDPRITILHGDSAAVLPKVLQDMQTPCLFWLDGHYSGGHTALGEIETPIREEVQVISDHAKKINGEHVILIDDARCFGHTKGYPSLEEFLHFLDDLFPGCRVEVQYDIIRVTPIR